MTRSSKRKGVVRIDEFRPTGVVEQLDLRATLESINDPRVPRILELLDSRPDPIVLYYVALKRRLDRDSFERCLKQMPPGQSIHVDLSRISGSEVQHALGHSLPQQGVSTLLFSVEAACHEKGPRAILLVVESATAKPMASRPIFDAVTRLIRQGRVVATWAVSVDRVTRSPPDAWHFVEACAATGTSIMIGAFPRATNPVSAIMLVVEMSLGALQCITISAGLRRGWGNRLDAREWLRQHKLLGMTIDRSGHPSYAPEDLAIVRKIFEDVASGVLLRDVVRAVKAEHVDWVKRHHVSVATIRRLVSTSVLTSGTQTWRFQSEERSVTYDTLVGLIPHDLQVLASMKANQLSVRRGIEREGPFESMLLELIEEHGHLLGALVDASGAQKGPLRWTAEGYGFRCPHCVPKRAGVPEDDGVMHETTADYEKIELVTGGTRNVRIPRFVCEKCERTSVVWGQRELAWLLAGRRVLTCPRDHSSLEIREVKRGAEFDAWRAERRCYVGHCASCGENIPLAAEWVPDALRLRLAKVRPRKVNTSAGPGRQARLDTAASGEEA